MANRVFTGLGFNISQEFKGISKAVLDIKAKQLILSEDGGVTAAETINSWAGADLREALEAIAAVT